MKNTRHVAVLSLLAVLFVSAPHAHAALLASQEDSSGTPIHYWHSDGSTGAFFVTDPNDSQPGFSLGQIATTDATVVGIHIRAQFNTSGSIGSLQQIPNLYDETGQHAYACAQQSSGGFAYGTAADALNRQNPLTAAQYNGQMVDMYFSCALGIGHDTLYANTPYRLYFSPLSVADVFDVYLASNAAGTAPFYEISGDGTYPAPVAPITISAPAQGTTYFSTDTIIPQATIANLSSFSSIVYLLNGVAIDPTLPLPISSLPSGPATLVIAATDSLGNTTYATSTFLVQKVQSPLTVTANAQTITLGAAIPTLSATLSGFINSDTAANSTTGAASCTTSALSTSPVGAYPINCTQGTLSSVNYLFATFVPATLSIVYRWDGFLQPINDTAHQIGLNVSVFKGGSTVPVKFQIKKADGTVVQSATAPLWSTPQLLGPMSTSIDELVYSDPASSGNTFKWDGSQYVYNWSTKSVAAGNWYRISAKLDDGTTQSVVIGLR